MRKIYLATAVSLASLIAVSCDTLKSLPTNTTGGLFSLNGTWRLKATSEGNALVGSTIAVYPVVGNASVKTISNNTYCVRQGDELWKAVKSNESGGFTISALVSACNGTTVYKDGSITVLTNDKVTVISNTTANTVLTQTWERVRQ